MATLEELRAIVGDDHASVGGELDSVDRVRATFQAEPGSVEEVSALLKLASEAGWAVAPRGSGSRLDLGNVPRRLDLVLGTSRLNRVLEHAAGDLVATVQAGITLDALQAHLAAADQMLAIDPPGGGSTIGGMIATNASGPRRLRYGTIRDLLIGVTVVLPDGTVAKSGGKVVKNVAGYDLGKLLTGSLGTLGVIVQATFRLHPRPAARRVVEIPIDTVESAGALVQRLMRSTLVPSAMEMDWPDEGEKRILVLFEGTAQGVEAQAHGAVALAGAASRVLQGEAWEGIAARPWQLDRLGLKITYLPAELPAAMHAIARATARFGVRPSVRGSVAAGVLYAGFPVQAPEVATGIVSDLRSAISEGSVVVQGGPARLRAEMDVWGPVGNALDLMRRVKHRFDPAGILNPGRFVGGI